jgi:hypothetical protein
MSLSIVDVCNSALAKVGASRISSLNDDTKEARLCKELYYPSARELLRSHPWNFAIVRVEVASIVAVPAFGFGYQFDLPSDCLRVLNVDAEFSDDNGSFYKWKIEGRKLLTDDSTAKIKYISDVSASPHLFDPTFAEALSDKIASDLAYPMAQSNSLAARLDQKYRTSLAFARSYDAQEGSSNRFSADEWLNSRF